MEESVKLAKELESTGISAIAVHGRTQRQKSSEPVNKGTYQTLLYLTFTNVRWFTGTVQVNFQKILF